MAVENSLLAIAEAAGAPVPEWVKENSYEISKWATTIRYNSNFRTNRDTVSGFNVLIGKWIEELKG